MFLEGANIGALVVLMAETHKHEGSFSRLEEVLVRLGDTMQSMTLKMDELLTRIHPSTPSSTPLPHHHPIPATNHRMKLEVPRFDGT